MKLYALGLAISLLAVPVAGHAQKGLYKSDPVSGYTRADGRYVQPYWRSAPGSQVYGYYPPTPLYGYQVPVRTYTPTWPMYSPNGDMDTTLRQWVGESYETLRKTFGEPDKIHMHRNNFWSAEYAVGAMRFEFFVNPNRKIVSFKHWGY